MTQKQWTETVDQTVDQMMSEIFERAACKGMATDEAISYQNKILNERLRAAWPSDFKKFGPASV